jgi:retinol dehydrogenase 12
LCRTVREARHTPACADQQRRRRRQACAHALGLRTGIRRQPPRSLLAQPTAAPAAASGVVTVASKAHYAANGIDWGAVTKKTRSITGLAEYSTSKLANVLFSAELARRLSGTGITTYSLHPGVVASGAWRHMPQPARWFYTRGMLSNEQGAQTSIYCALSSEVAGETGLYYDERRVKAPSGPAQDRTLAAELWERSVEWTR